MGEVCGEVGGEDQGEGEEVGWKTRVGEMDNVI